MTTDIPNQPTWKDVSWSMGGNDRYGDCVFVALANLLDLKAALAGNTFQIGEAECEYFYALETGFRADNPATDHGAVMDTVLKDWCAKGWPADPVCKPTRYGPIQPAAIGAALRIYGGLPCWAALPPNDDFTDDALSAEGVSGHAVLIVSADVDGLTLISWAEPVTVSWAWWGKFGRDIYGVELSTDPV